WLSRLITVEWGGIPGPKIGQKIHPKNSVFGHPRLKFTEKYPNLAYIESDLPEVINFKTEMIPLKRDNHILKPFNVIDDDIFMFDEYIYNPKTIMVAEGVMFYLRKNEMLYFLENIMRFLRLQGDGYFIFDAMHWEDETLTIRSMRKILVPLLKLENAPWPNFQDYHDGRNTLETKGFRVVGFEKKGKINIYTAAISQ
ncbi:MAG: hypothetical protein HYS70_05935, partial [Nitrospinae bacterium]|nr:hypothetical protein [Nitrospinota bacterium]